MRYLLKNGSKSVVMAYFELRRKVDLDYETEALLLSRKDKELLEIYLKYNFISNGARELFKELALQNTGFKELAEQRGVFD